MSPDLLRQYPLAMVIVPFVVATIIVTSIILWRWLSNRDAWPYHGGGSSGFLHDEFLRLGAIFIPYAILMIGARYYVYDLHPELLKSPYIYLLLPTVFVFRRLARFIPFVREAGKRVDAARAKERAAKAA